eukprot:jgi/Pico_ML_1/54483/g4822.t1
MVEKCGAVPWAKDYVYQTEEGYFLDPTDKEGKLSNKPGPGLPWPFPVPIEMALANEPPPGSGGANVEFEEKGSDVILVCTRDVAAGEELYLDYGTGSAAIAPLSRTSTSDEVCLRRMAWSQSTRVTLGAVLGSLVGFYVADRLEDEYKEKRKEKFREEVLKEKEKRKAEIQ